MALRQRLIAIARALAEQRVAYGSPCYMEITEGRQNWTRPDGTVGRYSWCGDTVTAVALWAGITDGRLLNREALNGPGSWRIGRNIDMLVSRARELGVLIEGAAALAYVNSLVSPTMGGDAYVMEAPNGGHAGILSHSEGVNRIVTYDGNGPGGTTGRNVRNFATSARLACVIPLTQWAEITRGRNRVGLVATTAPPPFPLLAETTGWTLPRIVPRFDEFYLNGMIGTES